MTRDPYWLVAKFASKCKSCSSPIRKGERIYFYPTSRTALCFTCGDKAAAEFAGMVQDEDVYNAARSSLTATLAD